MWTHGSGSQTARRNGGRRASIGRRLLCRLAWPPRANGIDPEAALVTLSATGALGEGAWCSGDVLLGALVACAGATLQSVATSQGILVRAGRVRAEGELDFCATPGGPEAAVGFRAIRLSFELETDAGPEELATLRELTERYSVVYQTLAGGPALSTTVAAA